MHETFVFKEPFCLFSFLFQAVITQDAQAPNSNVTHGKRVLVMFINSEKLADNVRKTPPEEMYTLSVHDELAGSLSSERIQEQGRGSQNFVVQSIRRRKLAILKLALLS